MDCKFDPVGKMSSWMQKVEFKKWNVRDWKIPILITWNVRSTYPENYKADYEKWKMVQNISSFLGCSKSGNIKTKHWILRNINS